MKSELKEQSNFVLWCREKGIRICATAQSTYTDSWAAISRNRISGVVKGLPDLVLVIPNKYRKNNKNKILFIEMKKKKGGVKGKEQIEWINDLNECDGVDAAFCKGADEAKEFVLKFLELEPPMDMSFINNLKK